jgi:hypothetical protein
LEIRSRCAQITGNIGGDIGDDNRVDICIAVDAMNGELLR